MKPSLRIGIDIGGTFTDFVIFDPKLKSLKSFKLLSTPDDPAAVVLHGLNEIFKSNKRDEKKFVTIIHGSTVATNTLLERKGARTAFITTRGFRDILLIGRQNRENLYDLSSSRPKPLVPDELLIEVTERLGPSGEIITPLASDSLLELIRTLNQLQPESIAICFLFSFANPAHELEVASYVRKAGYPTSVSSEILPEYREYERACTTVVNAYVTPILQKYLNTLDKSISQKSIHRAKIDKIRIMQSNGGIIKIDEARRHGVRCIFSGPAGGLIGAFHIARMPIIEHHAISEGGKYKDYLPVLSFDMGGTSTDVSLIDNEPKITNEAVIGGLPIRIPVLDIHTIGAGGGSIATVDAGGVLRVGPQSAGANPGPACYGKGMQPTVTDANVVLGRLQADYFLGGQMQIDSSRSKEALSRLGEQLELDTSDKLLSSALGVIEIINAHMERALRVISVVRGHDPKDYTLLSFGGAGGLHAADLARRLGVPYVLVPPLASTLSAFGMLAADVVHDYTKTVMLPGETAIEVISDALTPLIEQGIEDLKQEGFSSDEVVIEPRLDMRYRGQSYEITIPFGKQYIMEFHEAHHRAYGISMEGSAVEIVNIRARVIGRIPPIPITPNFQILTDPTPALKGTRSVIFPSGPVNTPLYHGESLSPGNIISGPALVVRSDTTILIGLNDLAEVDPYNNLYIKVGI